MVIKSSLRLLGGSTRRAEEGYQCDEGKMFHKSDGLNGHLIVFSLFLRAKLREKAETSTKNDEKMC